MSETINSPATKLDLPTPRRQGSAGMVVTEPRRWWQRSRSGLLLATVDIVTLFVVLVICSGLAWLSLAQAITTTAAVTFAFAVAHLYHSRFTVSLLDDLPRLTAIYIGTTLAVAWIFLLTGSGDVGTVALALAVGYVALVLAKTCSYLGIRMLHKNSEFTSTAIIVGTGEVGWSLGEAIEQQPTLGLRLVGFVDDAPSLPEYTLPAPHIGKIDDLPQVLEEYHPDHVILAYTSRGSKDLVDIVRSADRESVEISAVPRLFEMSGASRRTDEINGIPIARLHRAPFRSATWPLKRANDIVLSGLALLALSPLLAVIALTLRIKDGPGVIFRQERIGIDRVPFELMKFRSLKPADENESATNWNVSNDDRMTKFGKFLRKTSLDELPQLWNIFRGDMSLVGPRPERPHFVDMFAEAYPRYDTRHRVPCGLTGWAQIHGLRGDTSIEERARFDNYYIENWSLWFDLKIMLRTLVSLTKGAG